MKKYVVPNVYGNISIDSTESTAVPKFNGLLMVGEARQGIPYNKGKGYEVIQSFVGSDLLNRIYGKTNKFKTAVNNAKMGGAGVINTILVNPLSRVEVNIKDANQQSVFKLRPTLYGASGNDVKVEINNEAEIISISVVPVKYCRFLTKDVGAEETDRVSLEGVQDIQIGDRVYLEDNGDNANYIPAEVMEIEPLIGKLRISVKVKELTTAKYARLFKLDIESKKTAIFRKDESDITEKITHFLNQTGIIEAKRTASDEGNILEIANFDDFLGTLEPDKTNLGKSPIATSEDFKNVADSLPKLLEEFTNFTRSRIRLINLLNSEPDVHLRYLSLAKTLRAMQYSVAIVTGCKRKDIYKPESDVLFPINRAKSLNSDDFILAGMTLDEEKEPYETLASQIAGIVSGSHVKHNAVRDTISSLSVEKFFGEYNQETETSKFVASGVLVVSSTKNGYVLTHAVNTYQNQTNIWNKAEKKTYLIQQRQMADYVFESFREGMLNDAGDEGFDKTSATVKGNNILDSLVIEGVIKAEGKGVRVRQEGEYMILTPTAKLIDSNNIIVFDLRLKA